MINDHMDQKRYIICGISRAGKSTLATRIAEKLRCSRIPCDPLVTSFQNIYPDLGITHKVGHNDEKYFKVCKRFTSFMIDYIKNGLDREFDNYVIEGFHIDIEKLHKSVGETHTIIVMGYPDITYEEKMSLTRHYDEITGDWTTDLTDDQLKTEIEWFVHLSQLHQMKAEELGLTFLNTSENFEDKITDFVSHI